MVYQVKIKDIAEMAGVSVGTVDRVLHNRGHVSPARRKAVEDVLATVEYKHNLHTSAVSLRKGYKMIVTIPTAVPGEFWDTVYNGINYALQEYADIKIDCTFMYYNQFDIYSCRTVFDRILEMDVDAVIINPTFKSETTRLCAGLDKKNIIYSFVDSLLEDAHPI
ncbi:MAG: LacI family DNA-binding transcriptional regulator, partial [Candidatus Cryptobacteroides sp.]